MHYKIKALIDIGVRYNYRTDRDKKIGQAIVSLYNYHSLLNNGDVESMLCSLLDQYMLFVKETVEKEGYTFTRQSGKRVDGTYEVELEFISFETMPKEIAQVLIQKAELRNKDIDVVVMNLNKKL